MEKVPDKMEFDEFVPRKNHFEDFFDARFSLADGDIAVSIIEHVRSNWKLRKEEAEMIVASMAASDMSNVDKLAAALALGAIFCRVASKKKALHKAFLDGAEDLLDPDDFNSVDGFLDEKKGQAGMKLVREVVNVAKTPKRRKVGDPQAAVHSAGAEPAEPVLPVVDMEMVDDAAAAAGAAAPAAAAPIAGELNPKAEEKFGEQNFRV